MDPATLGTVIGNAVIVIWGLKRRKKQNIATNHQLASVLASEVGHIREQVELLKTIVAIHKDELHRVSDREMHIVSRIDHLEESIDRVEKINTQTLDFFQRKKASTLEERPLPGGHTAIKPKKG